MKKIVLSLILTNIFLFGASKSIYDITLHGVTLGKISDFTTIEKGYLLGKPQEGFLSLVLPYDNYIIFEQGSKPTIEGKNKYKKDKYFLLALIRDLQKEQPTQKIFKKEHYEINMNCNNTVCTYIRTNTKKQKSYNGYLHFKDGILLEICDDESGICFKKSEL